MTSKLLNILKQKKQQSTASTFQNDSKGFVMPMVLIMMSTLMIVAVLINQAIVVNQRQITRYGYVLIARAAAKAAVDYAKEELDSNIAYCGTAENRNSPANDQNSTVLYNDADYQVTYQVEIYDNVCNGTGRNIRAIGRVYIPDISLNVAYVQDIRVRLVRSGLYTESPGDFSPVAWYRSDVAASLRQASVNSNSNSFNLGTRHEEQLNGVTQNAVCSGSNTDTELHTGNENSGEQNIGLTFPSINIPRNATITNAYIQFRSLGISGTGGTNAQLSQPLSTRIRAYDQGNKTGFTCPGNNQLTSTAGLTAAQVDWAIPAWNSSNQSSAAQRSPALTTMVQTIVNRGDWNSGNGMGFRLQKVSGSGLRNASFSNLSHTRLFVEWTSSGPPTQATNGSTVTQWVDQTSNGNNLNLVNGTPILRTGQLNGKPIVEFEAAGDNPDVLANLAMTPTINNTRGLTVVAVMKPISTGSSTGNDRYIGLLNSSQADDTTTPAPSGNVRAFMRNALSTSLVAEANGYTPQPLSSVIGNNFGSASWGVYAFTISNTANERYSRNGTPSDLFAGGSNTSFSLNRLLLGGTSNGSGGYVLPGDMEIAELVVYDKPLSCSQIRLLENYYGQNTSWNVDSANYNCPLQ